MKVLTLTPDTFSHACLELERLVAADYLPDLVVGIASGGLHVSRKIFAGVMHISVFCRRPTTERKKRSRELMEQIRRLPLWARNTLRRVEARWLVYRPGRARQPRITLDNIPRVGQAARILVVDDAVDSGATMQAVVARLRSINPRATVRTACITLTTPKPRITPDYRLYSRTLIRFPWSADYR